MVPYVDPIELKTLEGVEERVDAKVEAAVDLKENPTTEFTRTLPEEPDETVTAEVDTRAEEAMSDLKAVVNVEVHAASSSWVGLLVGCRVVGVSGCCVRVCV